ncbi:hypothetical protein MESS2_730126 [Mesorhizobium metallidurans STM 2683]|uniref:Uncharacterized protein n=1 Tax=Mesorhizobium metallidurans STM 2683 TaxID=1297569 RepID=M5EW52_9HYPH|nr:hypothetical protein MESS2_730126 [Mesorhizobium metallidurans STM 2683]
MFLAKGLLRPHLGVSIRHAFKVPVRFDPDLIATEAFPSGSVVVSSQPNRRSVAAVDPDPGGSSRRRWRPQHEVAKQET